MRVHREPHPKSYEDTIRALEAVEYLLRTITYNIRGSHLGKGDGYPDFYDGKPREAPDVYHFTGVPCWVPANQGSGHWVLCVNREGTCFHAMGNCPERRSEDCIESKREVQP